ncbi:MAG: TetR/AcrR family transcriptional regulator [SAR324 cluster bacterium]|nr:TetR/AcrR family transcriptional regulator [SAR324 cluster bacterium]
MHETKEKILQQALQFVSLYGLDALSIGKLAKDTKMSKSGLFAHFNSKENLQIAVLEYSAQRFTEVVFRPATKAPRGVARIRALVDLWPNWIGSKTVAGDCPILSSLTEFDEKVGPVWDCLFRLTNQYHQSIVTMAQITLDEGEFKPDTNPEQFAFEFISLLLGYQAMRKLPLDPEKKWLKGVESLIERNEVS